VVLSHDESQLFSASSDQTVIIWDTGKREVQHTLKGHTGSVYTIRQSNDSRFIFSGSYDNTIIKWNLSNQSIQDIYHGFYTYLTSMTFSNDDRYLYSIDGEHNNFIK
jgi:WD40 repeat protein